MSTLIVSNGVVNLDSTVNASDVFTNGVLVDNATGLLNRATTGAGNQWSNGLFRNDAGQIKYVDATSGLPTPVYWSNGLPFDSNGALCVSSGSVASYSNGIPLAANGAVCVNASALASERFASSLNRRAQQRISATATRTKMWGRYKVVIGSDNFTSLRLLFQGTYQASTGDANVGNDVLIEACAFEKETGGAAFTQVRFGGSLSGTIPDGTNGYFSDPILPSDFGLAKFTRGEVYWVRVLCSVSSSSHGFATPLNFIASVSSAGGASLLFNPVTCSAGPVYGTGNSVYGTGTGGTGPSDFTFTGNLSPIVVGVPEGTAGKYVVGIGDSIVHGTGETAGGGSWYQGFFARALVNSDFVTEPIAGLGYGWPGTSAPTWSVNPSANSQWLLQYGNVAVEEYGTNSANYAGSSAIWAMLKARNYKIIRTKLLTITTSTDGWATTANQTKVAAWTTPTGDRIIFNGQVAAQAGILYDTFVDFDATMLDSGDRDLWKAPGFTADGTHPTSAGHETMATQVRTAIANIVL